MAIVVGQRADCAYSCKSQDNGQKMCNNTRLQMGAFEVVKKKLFICADMHNTVLCLFE